MNIIYYSNGICSLEGSSDIRGLQIFYTGKIEIDSKVPTGYEIMVGKDQILIFAIASSSPLTELFEYRGEFIIKSIIGADSLAQRVKVIPRENTEYADMLYTNAEDMTFNSEDMRATYIAKGRVKKSYIKQNILENLHTNNMEGSLYLSDNSEYTGFFHVHKKDQSCMTGKTHDKNSQDLFIKHGKKLLKTKNPKNIPQSHIYLNRPRVANRQIKRVTKGSSKGSGSSGSKGGSY